MRKARSCGILIFKAEELGKREYYDSCVIKSKFEDLGRPYEEL